MPEVPFLFREPNREDVQSEGSCRHHWTIETPRGRTSKGVCDNCGTEREFPNLLEDAMLPGARIRQPSDDWNRLGDLI